MHVNWTAITKWWVHMDLPHHRRCWAQLVATLIRRIHRRLGQQGWPYMVLCLIKAMVWLTRHFKPTEHCITQTRKNLQNRKTAKQAQPTAINYSLVQAQDNSASKSILVLKTRCRRMLMSASKTQGFMLFLRTIARHLLRRGSKKIWLWLCNLESKESLWCSSLKINKG